MSCFIVSGPTESSADIIEDPLCKYRLVIPVFMEFTGSYARTDEKVPGEFNFHKLHLFTHFYGYF